MLCASKRRLPYPLIWPDPAGPKQIAIEDSGAGLKFEQRLPFVGSLNNAQPEGAIVSSTRRAVAGWSTVGDRGRAFVAVAVDLLERLTKRCRRLVLIALTDYRHLSMAFDTPAPDPLPLMTLSAPRRHSRWILPLPSGQDCCVTGCTFLAIVETLRCSAQRHDRLRMKSPKWCGSIGALFNSWSPVRSAPSRLHGPLESMHEPPARYFYSCRQVILPTRESALP